MKETPSSQNHNVTIVAVNSSESQGELDTTIYIDDRLVFSDLLLNDEDFGSALVSIRSHRRITLGLPRGSHLIRVFAPDVGAEIRGEFEIGGDPVWIWIGYEDWDQNGNRVGVNEFALWWRLEPILFQ